MTTPRPAAPPLALCLVVCGLLLGLPGTGRGGVEAAATPAMTGAASVAVRGARDVVGRTIDLPAAIAAARKQRFLVDHRFRPARVLRPRPRDKEGVRLLAAPATGTVWLVFSRRWPDPYGHFSLQPRPRAGEGPERTRPLANLPAPATAVPAGNNAATAPGRLLAERRLFDASRTLRLPLASGSWPGERIADPAFESPTVDNPAWQDRRDDVVRELQGFAAPPPSTTPR